MISEQERDLQSAMRDHHQAGINRAFSTMAAQALRSMEDARERQRQEQQRRTFVQRDIDSVPITGEST